VSAFLKLDDGRYSFLLESVAGEEKVARFSFLGSHPRLLFKSRGRDIELIERVGLKRLVVRRFQTKAGPLDEIERLMQRFRVVPTLELPRFYGGLVGYLGYNTVRFIECLPTHRVETLRVPDIMLMLADSMVIVDHAQHKMLLVANAFTESRQPRAVYQECVSKLKGLASQLAHPSRLPASLRSAQAGRVSTRQPLSKARDAQVHSNVSKAEFFRMVNQAKRYIRAGDIIQVVLSQRFERPFGCAPFDVYRSLRSLNPSPYMYFLRFGPMCLVGSSPEMLVRCEEGLIETRPIAGTRPRGLNDHEDERLIQQLLRSPKERAEHLMLVDLGRNDLGRVAQVGSVMTPEFMVVEKYSHVVHLVSGVRARLRLGKTPFDVLRATFPAGTVTGAPKVRAMEIIAELEREDRGPYAGAVGYVSFSGNLDTCITIRTILMQGRRAFVQAGAGIVADSKPHREYQETIKKAQGMLEAIGLAERGFVT